MDKFEFLKKNSSDIFIELDDDLIIRDANIRLYDFMGCFSYDILNNSLGTFIQQEEIDQIKQTVNKLKNSHNSISLPFHLRDEQGYYKKVIGIFKLIETDTGNKICIFIKKKRSIYKERLLESKLEFERVVSRVSSRFVGIYDLDEAINTSLEEIGKFSGADRAYFFIFSDESETMSNTHEWCAEGVKSQMEILQDIPNKSLPWWMKKLQNGETIHIKDVSKLPNEAIAVQKLLEMQEIKSLLVFPILIKNELKSFIGFDNIREIGEWEYENFKLLKIISEIIGNALERKYIQEKLKKSQDELSRVNELKTELMRRATHELKTPLIAIKGFADLLLEVHKNKLDEEIISIVKEIKMGSNRLENLVKDLLKSSKLDSDRMQLDKKIGDLAEIIRIAKKEVESLAEKRNITLNLQIHNEMEAEFEGERIHEVLVNLLGNAIKYTPPNGKIDVFSEIENNKYKISVKDTGIGFTPEEKEKVFQQFGKIKRNEEEGLVSEGSGLGLFITRRIVELHGGKITMESRGRNKGSKFSFTLPIFKNLDLDEIDNKNQ
ncbi:MAG: GAF domain-containing protein [Candidatus Lokiarchaeota archaeon]|nr:GAF domain-containing protein [Candidatus Lokiarchaeota archaeon]